MFVNNAASGELVYDLNVVSCNDTHIHSTLSGGKSGNYKIVIWKSGIGNSIGDIDFSYIIRVNSISPN